MTKRRSIPLLVSLLLLAACGDDSSSPVDAALDAQPAPDSSVVEDASEPAASIDAEVDAAPELDASDAPDAEEPVAELDAAPEPDADAPDAALTGTAHVRIVAFNDFHGNLEPPTGSSGRLTLDDGTTTEAGGAIYLASLLGSLRTENPNTVLVSAGDLLGASPALPTVLRHEPTVEVMNALGLEFSVVGAHELDDGPEELQRLQTGGCHPADGCLANDPFVGARFQFLAGNIGKGPGQTLFPSHVVKEIDGTRIAFVGVTTSSMTDLVSWRALAGLSFQSEVDSVNALIPALKAQGVHTVVVLLHEGGVVTSPGLNGCDGLSAPLVQLVSALDDEVDVVVSGRTHAAYNCLVDGKRVTSALSFGRVLTSIDLEIDRPTGQATSVVAQNHPVLRSAAADTEVSALVQTAKTRAAAPLNRVLGIAAADLVRAQNSSGESPLGNLIADARRVYPSDTGHSGPRIAFVAPGQVRTDILRGNITRAQVFGVQPFGTSLVTVSLTGAQLDAVLEQQFTAQRTIMLQPSEPFRYAYSQSAPLGNRVDAASFRLAGIPIAAADTVRVTVDSFLVEGGDGFSVFSQGTERVVGDLDVTALESYLITHSPVVPPPTGRITRLP